MRTDALFKRTKRAVLLRIADACANDLPKPSVECDFMHMLACIEKRRHCPGGGLHGTSDEDDVLRLSSDAQIEGKITPALVMPEDVLLEGRVEHIGRLRGVIHEY